MLEGLEGDVPVTHSQPQPPELGSSLGVLGEHMGAQGPLVGRAFAGRLPPIRDFFPLIASNCAQKYSSVAGQSICIANLKAQIPRPPPPSLLARSLLRKAYLSHPGFYRDPLPGIRAALRTLGLEPTDYLCRTLCHRRQ
jgi:hypothetical protein